MEIYLVGGAVRDQLLDLPIKERDWVVVGSTVEEMLKQHFRQVGKDFPVFLHPKTNEEYALARKERKTGPGYTGFDFDTSEKVTLEEDLLRRDLTINAIAFKPNDINAIQNITLKDGALVDPFHGKQDIEKKLLRHVSSAFIEDPVRILRVARFAARFAELGFSVALETMDLMRDMVQSGEVNALVSERVWKELEKALQEQNPEQFFIVLEKCGALTVLFPEISLEQMPVLQKTSQLIDDPVVRFAALLFNLSDEKINNLCDRLRVPNAYRELALLVAQQYSHYLKIESRSAKEVVDLLSAADAFRREARFNKFLIACQAIAEVTQDSAVRHSVLNQFQWFLCVLEIMKTIDVKSLVDTQTVSGKEISELLYRKRIQIVNELQGNDEESS